MTAITVISRTQKIIVDPSSSAVAVINQGPAGPAGSGATVPTAWTAVTFQNGWVNVGSGYQTMQYRSFNDVVQLRGMIKSGTSGLPAFTLPVGFRPPAKMERGVITINPTGEVIPTGTGNISVFESYSSTA